MVNFARIFSPPLPKLMDAPLVFAIEYEYIYLMGEVKLSPITKFFIGLRAIIKSSLQQPKIIHALEWRFLNEHSKDTKKKSIEYPFKSKHDFMLLH